MSEKDNARTSNKVEILTSPSGFDDVVSRERLYTDLITGEIPGVQDLVTNTVTQIVTNISGNSSLLLGTVVTYSSATSTGTATVGSSTVNFINASSVRLEANDSVILSASTATPDLYAVGLYARAGGPLGYDIREFVVPSAVPGLPADVEPFGARFAQSYLSVPLFVSGDTASAITSGISSIVTEDWDTPVRTTVSLPALPSAGVWDGSASFSLCINGSVIVAAWGNVPLGSDPSLYVYDGSTWTSYDYARVSTARYPDSNVVYCLAARKNIAGVWTSGTWLIEVDSAGAVTDTDLTSTLGNAGTQDWIDAANGHIVITRINNNTLYVDGTAHAYTFGGVGKLPVYTAGLQQGRTAAKIYGDKLYFLYTATGEPGAFDPSGKPVGLGIMDLTSGSLATVSYDDIITATGNREDGEPIHAQSLEVVNGTHVAIGGSRSMAFEDPVLYASNLDTRRPCVWLYNLASNTVTSYATNDARYTGYTPWVDGSPAGTYVIDSQLTVGCEPGSTELILLNAVQPITSSPFANLTPEVWLEGLNVV